LPHTDVNSVPSSSVCLSVCLLIYIYINIYIYIKHIIFGYKFALGKVKRQFAVLFAKFQAFLYALIDTSVRSLRSDSGQSMSGAEKGKREGRHIEMTFSL